MSIPKRRKTSARRDQRRMHLFLKSPALALCPKCGKPVKSHTVCLNCGYYKGKEIIDVLGKLTKKEKKKREKEMRAAEKERPKASPEKPLTMEELSKK